MTSSIIHIETFCHAPFNVNSYVVWDEATRHATLIDIGRNVPAVLAYLESHTLTCENVLHTHAFLECLEGQPELRETHEVVCHMSPMDEFWLAHLDTQATVLNVEQVPMAFVDQQVMDGDTIGSGSLTFTVMETPGNTPGSVSYYLPQANAIFVGDVLFKDRVGPVDIPHGNLARLKETIETRLFAALPAETTVYPSRGPATTLGAEQQTNTFEPIRYGTIYAAV